MHKHECDKCGCVWEHDESAKGHDEAHKCPQCQREEIWIYHGSEPAQFTNHHVKEAS